MGAGAGAVQRPAGPPLASCRKAVPPYFTVLSAASFQRECLFHAVAQQSWPQLPGSRRLCLQRWLAVACWILELGRETNILQEG